ncbi:hypothetical protein OH76DRAFT_1484944 [Lentinus brumalis]|uniref:Uncharacterized protein n=1 Tax=Lentinus brumalis TaxID=2498619 RepID=A0A371D3K7_9APHY|nr:hypothetical protein OH76DRAFT_1484944 [Polyporus brumalis]
MPSVSSRTHRAEAKYNVTLDFPNLGLHSAAASGNLGLVTYALDHGQPVNSVLDGVLPLHVASSGGNDLIVRLLIERGADVNAPRLPRKYSSDRHRDTSAPIVGSSGATPLHFAAANGHEHVVLTLLLHGAHPDRADKHNITPQMLARQNGWTRCAELLSKWTHEKDRDLRERETLAPELDAASRDECDCKPFDKKLKVKRSIDNALNKIRPSLPTPPSSGQIYEDASYSTSSPPIQEGYASVESSPDTTTEQDFPSRRPSLPHIFDAPPHGPTHTQSASTQQHHSKSSGRPSLSSSRRPRSAGTDADSVTASTSSTPGRIRGKISLLHMFKKSAGDSATSSPGAPATPESSGYASSSSLVTSASASPAPEREGERTRGPSANSPLRTRASESGSLSAASSSQPYTATLTTVPSSRSRLGGDSKGSSEASFPPLAVELHRKLSMERVRDRSGSGSSTNAPEMPAKAQSPSMQPPPLPQLQGHRSPPVRPGILRPHARSASSGQPPSVPGDGSARSLRFDSTSAAASVSTKRSGLGLDLKPSGSVSSLRGESASHAVAVDDDDDEGYGEVISPRIGLGLGLVEGKTRLHEIKSESHPLQRRPSTGSQLSRHSSTGSTLPSPTASHEEAGFDCPFSINRPPLQPSSSDDRPSTTNTSESQRSLLGIHGIDNRGRGDSFGSSMSASTDASMPQTPAPTPGLGLQIRSPDATSLELPLDDAELLEERSERGKTRTRSRSRSRADSSASRTGYFSELRGGYQTRSRTMSPGRMRAPPLDIDIRAISSHAQAEALVQRAQKSILDREDVDIELPGLGLVNGSAGAAGVPAAAALGGGRTPLSAKLAAYGESLAIERRFKEKEERERGSPPESSRSMETPVGSPRTPSQSQSQVRTRSRDQLRSMRSESGVRKFSLEERPVLAAPAPRRTKPRRPHTADGETSDHTSGGFLSPSNRQPVSPGHKPTLSGSAIGSSRPSPASSDNSYIRLPASSRTLPVISSPPLVDLPPRIVRSRTPDPDTSYYYDVPSPVSPSGGDTFGVPLSRVSTAPPRHASPDIVTQRSISEQERERARANKLMKMGLLAHDSFPRSHSPYGHARNGGGSGGSGGKQRFGGIRGFVQTLTGKT